MSGGLVTAAYIIAALLFIFSLAGLSKHETSRAGIVFGIAGMAIALAATILGPQAANLAWILVAMMAGGGIGIFLAQRVEMTEMPELVAILHSFVGLAAVLVGINSYLDHAPLDDTAMKVIHLVEVFLGIFIGAITFTGSVVAFSKLRGIFASKPLMLPGRHGMNLAAVAESGIKCYDANCTGVWLASCCFNRRRRYAGGCLNAQLLFRLGSGGGRFYAQ